MSPVFREKAQLVMDWLIVGVRLDPDNGRVRVMATKTTRDPQVLYVSNGLARGYRFQASSDDIVVCEGATYAEALAMLGRVWDADAAGKPTELEAGQAAIEGAS